MDLARQAAGSDFGAIVAGDDAPGAATSAAGALLTASANVNNKRSESDWFLIKFVSGHSD
jgi:hypothetical protein